MERFKKNTLSTSNANDFKQQPPVINGPDKFKSAGNKILTGTEKVSYQSSMKESMVPHNLVESFKNL